LLALDPRAFRYLLFFCSNMISSIKLNKRELFKGLDLNKMKLFEMASKLKQ